MSSAVNAALNNGAQSLNHNQDHLGQNAADLSPNIGNNATVSPSAKSANHNPPVSLVSPEKAATNPVVNKMPEKEVVDGNKVRENQSNGTQEPIVDSKSGNNGEAPQQANSPVKAASHAEGKPPTVEAIPNSNNLTPDAAPKLSNEPIDKPKPAQPPIVSESPVKKDTPPSESSASKVQPEPVEKLKETPVQPVQEKKENYAESAKSSSPAKSVAVEKAKPAPVVVNKPSEVQTKAEEPKIPETAPVVAEKPQGKVDTSAKTKPEPTSTIDKVEIKPAAESNRESMANKPDVKSKSPAKPEQDKSSAKTVEYPAKPVENPSTESSSPSKEEVPVTPTSKKTEVRQKSTLKLATVAPTMPRKRKKDVKMPLTGDSPSPPKRNPREKKVAPSEVADAQSDDPDTPNDMGTLDGRGNKRNRTKVQPYQVPTPELAMLTKLSVTQERTTPTKQAEDKLIVFYKNEFLAVRNAEGSFYVCQTMQNVYRSTRKIKIRWLSQDKAADPKGEIYKADFYDTTDIECVLTTLSLQRASSGWKLGAAELARTQSILGRALAAERGEPTPETSVTEEHPDGLDLSLYKDESQLEKKKQSATPSRKRRHSKSKTDDAFTPAKASKLESDKGGDEGDKKEQTSSARKSAGKSRPSAASETLIKKTPAKKGGKAARSPKSKKKSKIPGKVTPTPKEPAATSKTATPTPKAASPVVTPKVVKKIPVKSVPARVTPSTSKGKTHKITPSKAAVAAKAAQLASTPSTSTGKATRTPRKPPAKK